MAKEKAAVSELITPPENLVGYQEIDLHMIFYINRGENFGESKYGIFHECFLYSLLYKDLYGLFRTS